MSRVVTVAAAQLGPAEADDLMHRLGRAQAQGDYMRAGHLLDALRRHPRPRRDSGPRG